MKNKKRIFSEAQFAKKEDEQNVKRQRVLSPLEHNNNQLVTIVCHDNDQKINSNLGSLFETLKTKLRLVYCKLQFLTSSSVDKSVIKWELDTREIVVTKLATFKNNGSWNGDLIVEKKKNRFLTFGYDKNLAFYCLESGEQLIKRQYSSAFKILPWNSFHQGYLIYDCFYFLNVWDGSSEKRTINFVGIRAFREYPNTKHNITFAQHQNEFLYSLNIEVRMDCLKSRDSIIDIAVPFPVSCLAFIPETEYFACGFTNGGIGIVNKKTKKCVYIHKDAHKHEIIKLVCVSKSKFLISMGKREHSIKIWSIVDSKNEQGKELVLDFEISNPFNATCESVNVLYSFNQIPYAVVGDFIGNFFVVNLRTKNVVSQFPGAHHSRIRSIEPIM